MKAPGRWIALACALVGAGALALSVWFGAWWHVGDVTIGPLGSYACFSGECGPRSLSWIDPDSRWLRVSFATGVAGLLAMGLLIIVAGAIAANRAPKQIAKMTLVSLATALACALGFVLGFPGVAGAELGIGAALYAAALPLGAIASLWSLRSRPAA